AEHAFINPAMVLLYERGHTDRKAVLAITDLPDSWRLASAVPSDCNPASEKRWCRFNQSSYDELADSPIEVGKFTDLQGQGVEAHFRAIVHIEKVDNKRLGEELRLICSYELKLMEGAPFENYTFLVHLGKAAGTSGGGGMEHANSTAIAVQSEGELLNV